MAKLIIKGGVPLKGKIWVAGSKNAALPCLTATLLSPYPCTISNIPDITDVKIMIKILKGLGAKIKKINPGSFQIVTKEVKKFKIPSDLACLLRASILLAGPLLARFGKCLLPHPGGCIIGKRPIDTHLEAFKSLGLKIQKRKDGYFLSGFPCSGKIFLDEVSVTATENAIMASVLSPGKTTISPAACEPHVINLVSFLTKMGAKITGAGTHKIEIIGVKNLKGVKEHKINPDEIEAGSFAIAAAATGGGIEIEGIEPENLDCILHKLTQMGVKFALKKNNLKIFPSSSLKPAKIQIDTWPRLPTDLQPQFTVLATQAKGKSLIHDWMFEGRFGYLKDLIKMGAKIKPIDPHRAEVWGPTALIGQKITSPDIRAGMALIIAGLVAKGKTEINRVELVDRGYQKIDQRLKKIGARTVRRA